MQSTYEEIIEADPKHIRTKFLSTKERFCIIEVARLYDLPSEKIDWVLLIIDRVESRKQPFTVYAAAHRICACLSK